MSGQYGLSLEDKKIIFDMLERYDINLIYEVVDGKEYFNEISLKISDEEGLHYYFQIN